MYLWLWNVFSDIWGFSFSLETESKIAKRDGGDEELNTWAWNGLNKWLQKLRHIERLWVLICVGVLSGGEERGEIGSVQKIKTN